MEKQRPNSIAALTYDITLKDERPVLHHPQVLASPSAKNIRYQHRYTSTGPGSLSINYTTRFAYM